MENSKSGLTRASLLQRFAAAPIAIGAFAALAAEADAKAPQNAVMYQDKPKDGKKCAGCKFYIKGKTATANGACTQVAGSISPNGYCVVYAAGKAQEHAEGSKMDKKMDKKEMKKH
ncbi:MAG: high-potential iron-sulfur protein [Candidatus Eremiobacteraeota bacterium]|nr:high-potential iron-sulfur protein [Candidatus Eremiobacteraeota bacterium]